VGIAVSVVASVGGLLVGAGPTVYVLVGCAVANSIDFFLAELALFDGLKSTLSHLDLVGIFADLLDLDVLFGDDSHLVFQLGAWSG
jgi:hypothetical protein